MNEASAFAYLTQFQLRVVQCALTEATAEHWDRRAAEFDRVATIRPGGRQTEHSAGIREQAAARASACRQKAAFLRAYPECAITDVELRLLLALVTGEPEPDYLQESA